MQLNMKTRLKVNRKTVGAVFLALLLVVVFFSKTIYAHNLPSVAATLPKSGKLTKSEKANGITTWKDKEMVYAAVGGKVEEVLVEEGETVKEGQPILKLSFDEAEAASRLKELGHSRQKLVMDIEAQNTALARAKDKLADLYNETISDTDYELRQLELQIDDAHNDMLEVRERYDEDEADYEELARAKNALQRLYIQKEQLLEQQDKSREEKEKDLANRIRDCEEEIASIERSLKSLNLDLAGNALQQEPYQKAMEDYQNATITAPCDGVVANLPLQKGEKAGADALLFELGVGTVFEVVSQVPLSNNFISTGDDCALSNATYRVQGKVTKVSAGEQNKTITVSVDSADLKAGETLDIEFEKTSKTSYTLVPNSALNRDSEGYFLYQIKERDGILGKEYYVDRLSVHIGDSDSKNTAIVQGISFFEPVVLLSDKSLSAGQTVKVENEGDLFDS